MSEKLEDANPGNLLVSVVRKVIKEEQGDSNMVVETSDRDGFREIVKAADAFASRVGAGHGVDMDKNPQGQRQWRLSQRKDLAGQRQQQGKFQGEQWKAQKDWQEIWQRFKNVVSPGKTGRKSTSSDGKKNTGKRWNERKNKGDKNGGKAKNGQS